MKIENVKFGWFVVAKTTCKIVRVSAVRGGGLFCGEVVRADQFHPSGHQSNAWCADCFRQPRLKDLRKGDVFEFDIRRPARFSVEEATPISIKVKVHKDSKEGIALMENEFFFADYGNDRVRIISLAEEAKEVEPNKKVSGDLVFVNKNASEALTILAEGSISTPGSVAPSTKLNVTEKKPEPRKGEIVRYFNVYHSEGPYAYGSRKSADDYAAPARIACVKATIQWEEGQFDE